MNVECLMSNEWKARKPGGLKAGRQKYKVK